MRALLARARGAVAVHRYADAIAAYDAAQEVMDPRAEAQILSERGYTRLLAGDGPGALRDLSQAADIPTDARLLGQVWFNLGLTNRTLRKESEALLDFHRSDRIHSTPQAMGQLAGKKVCPVVTDPTRVEARSFRDWSDWSKHVGTDPKYAGAIPSETAAHAVGDGPWVVELGANAEGIGMWEKRVLARRDGRIYDFGAFGHGEGGMPQMMCGRNDRVDIVRVGGRTIIHALTIDTKRVAVGVDPKGHIGGSWAADDAACHLDVNCDEYCFEYRETYTYVVLDLSRPSRALTLVQENDYARIDRVTNRPPLEVTVTPREDGFELASRACDGVAYP